MATRKPYNGDGILDGSALVQVDIAAPVGEWRVWDLLVAEYSGAPIVGMRVDAWYQPLISPNTDASKNTPFFRAIATNNNEFPLIGGGMVIEVAGQPVLATGLRALIQMPQEYISVAYDQTTVAGRNFQIRGLYWQCSSLQEALCIAQSLN